MKNKAIFQHQILTTLAQVYAIQDISMLGKATVLEFIEWSSDRMKNFPDPKPVKKGEAPTLDQLLDALFAIHNQEGGLIPVYGNGEPVENNAPIGKVKIMPKGRYDANYPEMEVRPRRVFISPTRTY